MKIDEACIDRNEARIEAGTDGGTWQRRQRRNRKHREDLMMDKNYERCCRTCIYHEYEDVDWICNCPTSDLYTDWTDCECTCQEWEGRREEEY